MGSRLRGAVISPEEFVERLCRLGADRGPRRFPRGTRDREILMKSVLMLLRSDRVYSEPEINAVLKDWNRDVAPAIESDHVTLRRLLVDYGHLERTADGERYRVGFPARPMLFDFEVEGIDVRATIAVFREQAEERRRRARVARVKRGA
jgi:hypothetical protein